MEETDLGIFLRIVFWIIIGVLLLIVLPLNIWGYRDIDELKERAPTVIEEAGYDNPVYMGYTGNMFDGGGVYYQCNRSELPALIYWVSVYEWRGEYHIYRVDVVNENYVVSTDNIPQRTE